MSAILERLPDTEDANVVMVAMLTTQRAVDLYLGDLSRRSRSATGRTTREYNRVLKHFTNTLRVDTDVSEITSDDCRRFLDSFTRKSMGYQATVYAILNSFFKWLDMQGRVKRNPMDKIPKPRRIHPDNLDVTTVAKDDARKLLAAAQGWTERLAVAIPMMTGARRSAVANLKLEDYNAAAGELRFKEKGGKIIWKPVPHELKSMLDAAIAAGVITEEAPWLVPAEGGLSKGAGVRDDRVIWRAVKSAADRAGVKAHVHALRAAFAVNYLEQRPGDVEALKELMGHESIATTQTYLRRLDKRAAMERVREVSWGFGSFVLESSPVVGAGGFEPPTGDSRLHDKDGTQRRPGAG